MDIKMGPQAINGSQSNPQVMNFCFWYIVVPSIWSFWNQHNNHPKE